MQEIMVSIICNTYNQKEYVRDAIESFLMQETSFNYEILIHDDSSNDGTIDIIKEYAEKYPDLIYPIYQSENQYSKGTRIIEDFQLPRARGKYIALCEGDDFWTEKKKLQIQVDYLETHPTTSMTCHAGYYVDDHGYKLPGLFRTYLGNQVLSTSDVIKKWICPTGSIVFRKDPYLINCFPVLNNAPCGDYPMMINMSLYGEIYYFDKVMSAYRINPGSVSAEWRNSSDKAINKNERFIYMLNQIDEITKFKFEKDIDNMRARREYEILLLKGKFREARKSRYSEFYQENRKSYFFHVLKYYIPIVEKFRTLLCVLLNKSKPKVKVSVF